MHLIQCDCLYKIVKHVDCTVSLYKKYTKEKTFVIFRGDHGLLGLQDGEDSAQDAYAHAGRRREWIRMNINICSI